jgi:CRP-like cAMP-binding protein
MSHHSVLQKMIGKLRSRADLNESDCAAILALPYILRAYEAPAYILREGEPPKRHCSFVVSGLAFRQKLTADGARQIVSIHMTGDFLDLQHLFLNRADHSVQALTRIECAEIEREALQEVVLRHPAIGRAMWVDALVDASIFREWVLNVGRRDARARVAHLLCEVALRMEAAGIAEHHRYELPMTQEQLGDAVGLTPVHVNRTLKVLTEEGLIHRDKRYIRFENWEKIRAAADFSALYLHLDQTLPSVV